MPEPIKRSEILQKQIDALIKDAPKAITQEERTQIMKGRKSQADLDAGRAAIQARVDEVAKHSAALERLNAQLGDALKDEGVTAKEAAATQTKNAKDAEKKSGYGIALEIGSGAGASLGGYAAGRQVIGKGINWAMDKAQSYKNKTLAGVAEDRLKGITTREGALGAVERSGAMPSANSVVRVGSRMLAHGIAGAGMAGKGGLMLSQVNPDDPLETRSIDRGMGLGLIGAGLGITEQGAQYAIAPGVSPDAKSIAIINSQGLRRGGIGPDASAATAIPPPRGPTPGTMGDLMQQARTLNIPGRSTMRKDALASAVAEALKKVPKGTASAILAGGLAYAMSPKEAQAADGSTTGGTGEAATNAAVAGGAAYGTNRLIGALPAGVGKAVGVAGEAAAPSAIDAMTDYSPEDMARANNWMGRNLPSWLQPRAAQNDIAMSQLPTANPYRSQIDSVLDEFEQHHMAGQEQ